MSTVRFNTWQNTDGTENYKCRAWVNFDGTTSPGTIRASGNVSSVARNGTGDFTVNFTTAMPDANYCLSSTAGNNDTATSTITVRLGLETDKTTSNCRVYARAVAGAGSFVINAPSMNITFFR